MKKKRQISAPILFCNLAPDEALKKMESYSNGLSTIEAQKRLKQNGFNTLKTHRHTSSFLLFVLQFKSPVTILLVIAASLSMLLKDTTDSIIILFIIIVSSLLGFWQEKGAANVMNELLKRVQIRCSILRDGIETALAVEQLVPGDIIILKAGDIIPADCLIIESKDLYVDEAAFTGETFPVEKNTGIILPDEPLGKRSNSLFMGSHVISGIAKALVMNTGKNTQFGNIAGHLKMKIPETDFEKGIRHLGYMLMEITLVLVIIIFSVNVILQRPALDSILFSLALAVGLTPQLLPVIISINLSVGAKEMAKKNVIVKRLSSIENFGSMNILCTDKTGTITEGKVVLKDALNSEGEHADKTLFFAYLNASLQKGYSNPIDQAIQISGKKYYGNYTIQAEVPYDFIRKRLTVQVRLPSGSIAITKGALNAVLSICDTVETGSGEIVPLKSKLKIINNKYEELSNDGMRVLGIAYKSINGENDFTRSDETNMVFAGFITLFDPPKKEVQNTLTELSNLGVKLKIITGDNELVARSLAGQIGLNNPVIIKGKQIQQMSNDALQQQALHADIFAEVEPNQKERIILSLKKSGNVVGFMGDGINDAAAIHVADVGISVDTAVDVAKEAAHIVLMNQSLEVLITGIIAGRKTFANTMKYIFMATSANFGNMFSMAGASLFLPFLPFLPKQILLINLLTDFPETAIATDKVDASGITKPHRWDIRFIKRYMIVFGLISSIFDYITFLILLYYLKASQTAFQTSWFLESVISATMMILVMRTRLPFLKSQPGKELIFATSIVILLTLLLPFTPLADVLSFTPVPFFYYTCMLLIILAYIASAELIKNWFFRRYYRTQ